jgi:solute carrier family 25 phosphate transporter 23/24/25/41
VLSLAPFIAVNFAAFDTMKSAYYGDRKFTSKELKSRNPLVVLSLGAAAGVLAQTVCYPLDTVRRRMQLKGVAYPSTLAAFATIAREEGPRGFYRGMLPKCVRQLRTLAPHV